VQHLCGNVLSLLGQNLGTYRPNPGFELLETMLYDPQRSSDVLSRITFLEQHLARLSRAITFFQFTPHDLNPVGAYSSLNECVNLARFLISLALLDDIKRQLLSALMSLNIPLDTQYRLRLLLGYGGVVRAELLALQPLPSPYRLDIARGPINSRNPFLLFKTTIRNTYSHFMTMKGSLCAIYLSILNQAWL
jgi:hypothetical protein